MNKFVTKMQSARQIFDNLLGIWSIKRVLGNYGTAEGIGKFTLQNQSELTTASSSDAVNNVGATALLSIPPSDENTLVVLYREDLQVKYNNYLLGQQLGEKSQNTAYQEYVYLYDTVRDKIIKKFTSGATFYELSIDIENQVAHGDHLCIKDFYKATYAFKDPQNFSLSYYVKGPEKDYRIETEYTKQNINSQS